jgi:hypothetical protein
VEWEEAWVRNNGVEWKAAAPAVKIEEEEPVLEWPEDRESVLRSTREATPYPSPATSKFLAPFVIVNIDIPIGWSEFDDADVALAALTMADMQGEGEMDGERLMIEGFVAADRGGMTAEWVNAVRAVVRDLE